MDILDQDGLQGSRASARESGTHRDQEYPFTARVTYITLYTEHCKI